VSQIEILLNHLEGRLRLLIEGNAALGGFPSRLHRRLGRELMRVMKTASRMLPDKISPTNLVLTAPDQYTLILPTIEAQILLNHPTELDRLAHRLEKVASHAGISFATLPLLHVVADPRSPVMNIIADFSCPDLGNSCTYPLQGNSEAASVPREKLPNAFLIVNGLSTFLINLPVINIGRDSTNQLQLDDPQISRQHAQVRFIQGHFVIFDLDSRGGTFVNDVLVSSHVLKPGDVIQLSRLPLVFGLEDNRKADQTQELMPVPLPPEVL
jgi:hypothetical protein